MFPVLWQVHGKDRERFVELECPKRIPWALVAPHEQQALDNHGQTLQRLAARGGLSPSELVAVIDGHPCRWVFANSDESQIPRLKELVAKLRAGEQA